MKKGRGFGRAGTGLPSGNVRYITDRPHEHGRKPSRSGGGMACNPIITKGFSSRRQGGGGKESKNSRRSNDPHGHRERKSETKKRKRGEKNAVRRLTW